jgi:hypothetical protein
MRTWTGGAVMMDVDDRLMSDFVCLDPVFVEDCPLF